MKRTSTIITFETIDPPPKVGQVLEQTKGDGVPLTVLSVEECYIEIDGDEWNGYRVIAEALTPR